MQPNNCISNFIVCNTPSALQTLKEFFLELKYANWVTFGIGITAIVVQVINNELLKVSFPNLRYDSFHSKR